MPELQAELARLEHSLERTASRRQMSECSRTARSGSDSAFSSKASRESKSAERYTSPPDARRAETGRSAGGG